jgi:hypothetical protein
MLSAPFGPGQYAHGTDSVAGYYGLRVYAQESPDPGGAWGIGPGPCIMLEGNFRESPNGEVRRIPIPRTPVNKGKRKG